MKPFTKTFLKISLACLVVGAVLLGAGYASGGVQAIQKITEPSKQTKTFSDISDIELDTYRRVRIQAGNADKASVSYYSGSKFEEDIELVSKEGKLTINGVQPNIVVAGGIEVFGYLLNERMSKTDYGEIVITLPKDKSLDSISGSGFQGLTITNMTVKNLDYGADIYIENSKIDGGKLAGAISIYESELKDMTIENYYNLSNISDSKLENLTIIDQSNGLSVQNTTLKNVAYSSGLSSEEIDKIAKETNPERFYNYEGIYLSVELNNVKFLGDNSFMASEMDIAIDLTPDSKTSLDIQSLTGDIQLDEQYKDIAIIQENSKTTVSHTEKDATGKLIIKNNQGTISIK